MSGLTVSSTTPTAPPPKPVKERRIPPKISQIVDWLLTGACKNQQAACERANLDPSYVSRELRKVHVQAFMTRRAAESISNGKLVATATLIRLLNADSEHVAAKMADRLLTSEGLLKSDSSQVTVNANHIVGYVIDLSGSVAPRPAMTVEHVGPTSHNPSD